MEVAELDHRVLEIASVRWELAGGTPELVGFRSVSCRPGDKAPCVVAWSPPHLHLLAATDNHTLDAVRRMPIISST